MNAVNALLRYASVHYAGIRPDRLAMSNNVSV